MGFIRIMITAITLLPLFAAFLILLMPARRVNYIKTTAFMGAIGSLLMTSYCLYHFDASAGLQFEEKFAWIPLLSIEYHVGLDGFNALLVLLVSIVTQLVLMASLSVTKNVKTYFIMLLLEVTALYGVFTSLNFFQWFLYWEVCLIPIFVLIKTHGGENRHKAAISFVLFTVLGSVAMLIAFLFLYVKTGTFDFIELAQLAKDGQLKLLLGDYYFWIFLCILMGFWVKVPLVPLHIWQIPTYAQAPIPVTMFLTGVLSKMGIYGFLRIVWPLFPEAMQAHAEWLIGFALATLLLGAFAAMRQKHLRAVMTYSSLNHVAYCAFGVFAMGFVLQDTPLDARSLALQGVILQMFSHGIVAAGLFYMIGILESRTKTDRIDQMSGLGNVIPKFTAIFGILAFSSLGLPFLAGFSAEILIFSGSFALAPTQTILATLALLATGVFILNAIRNVFTGPKPKGSDMADITPVELSPVLPFVFMSFLIGILPSVWLVYSNKTVQELILNLF